MFAHTCKCSLNGLFKSHKALKLFPVSKAQQQLPCQFKQQMFFKRYSSSYSSSNSSNNNNNKSQRDGKHEIDTSDSRKNASQQQQANKNCAPEIPSFMPVVSIPMSELAHNAFYSLHRPLFGLSIPEPFLVGDMVGQIEKQEEKTDNEANALAQYMRSLRPFEPPELKPTISLNSDERQGSNNCIENSKCSTTTTLTIEVDPAYFLKHNGNHDEITDYLTAMQEKLDLLYRERDNMAALAASIAAGNSNKAASLKKRVRRLRKRSKGFFEKN